MSKDQPHDPENFTFAWEYQILGNVRKEWADKPFGELDLNMFYSFCDEQQKPLKFMEHRLTNQLKDLI